MEVSDRCGSDLSGHYRTDKCDFDPIHKEFAI